MRDVTRAKIPSRCGAIWRTILNFYASQGVWVNCYRIHQKSLNFIYPFKFYSNFTNKNVSWLHFSWATQYTILYYTIQICIVPSGTISLYNQIIQPGYRAQLTSDRHITTMVIPAKLFPSPWDIPAWGKLIQTPVGNCGDIPLPQHWGHHCHLWHAASVKERKNLFQNVECALFKRPPELSVDARGLRGCTQRHWTDVADGLSGQ